MSNPPGRLSIQQLGLENGEELSLYLELIRIIEKDIEELKAGDARNGWTSWAIIGGIVATALLLFGETRKLQSFPTVEVETIWLGGVLLYNVAVLGIRAFCLDETNIRPGRIRWPKDVYFSFVPSGIYVLLIFLASTLLTLRLPLALLVKTTTSAALIFCSLL